MKATNWLFIIIVTYCLFACLIDQLRLITNPAYSIGTVDYCSPGGRTDSDIHFQYGVNDATFHQGYENGTHGWFVPADCTNCSSGNKFMVQYDSIDPSIARVLFNYHLADSEDYKKDLTLFKKTPPGY